jgi:hypothetical protein
MEALPGLAVGKHTSTNSKPSLAEGFSFVHLYTVLKKPKTLPHFELASQVQAIPFSGALMSLRNAEAKGNP